MTFEEFQQNLQQIRKYTAKLSKYKVSWYANEIYKGFEHQVGVAQRSQSKKKTMRERSKKRRAVLRNNSLPADLNDFYYDITAIITDKIFDKTAEDWKEDKVYVETDEDGREHLVYRGEYPGVFQGTEIIPEDRDDNLRFKILRDYYLSGYEVKHIAKLYGYACDEYGINRTSVYEDQLPKGREELYQLYCERRPEE